MLTAVLPSGERLVYDAFDEREQLLIEAKSSNSRADVRMAIGQSLDYQLHIKPNAQLSVLLPGKPSETIIEVLHAQGMGLIYGDGTAFHGPE
ncbi:hypothetical protein [Kutzneria albida]|uniref:Uncharacterized protein n=1 Tax=Kutzneria albida DSM 43870 TaxID=1449976 RepID=W5WCU6_9PSEU|nr:hypothetical protein [Kutzneria albida]AHH98580.1 hypothetical protein KALB_5218 [Kutzneria albida DSM 43870]